MVSHFSQLWIRRYTFIQINFYWVTCLCDNLNDVWFSSEPVVSWFGLCPCRVSQVYIAVDERLTSLKTDTFSKTREEKMEDLFAQKEVVWSVVNAWGEIMLSTSSLVDLKNLLNIADLTFLQNSQGIKLASNMGWTKKMSWNNSHINSKLITCFEPSSNPRHLSWSEVKGGRGMNH